jgi:hypothetical protein
MDGSMMIIACSKTQQTLSLSRRHGSMALDLISSFNWSGRKLKVTYHMPKTRIHPGGREFSWKLQPGEHCRSHWTFGSINQGATQSHLEDWPPSFFRYLRKYARHRCRNCVNLMQHHPRNHYPQFVEPCPLKGWHARQYIDILC